MYKTICKNCKNEFEHTKKNRIFCSPDCHKKSRQKPLVKRQCGNQDCPNEFTVKFVADKTKYCSSSCAAKVNNKKFPKRDKEGACRVCDVSIPASRKYCTSHSGKTGELYEKQPVEKICKNDSCQTVFVTLYKNKVFCNKTCSNEWNKKFLPKDNSRSIVCPKCSGAKTQYAIYCKLCSGEERITLKIQSWLSGEWRGGTDLNLSETIRLYLLEQENYTCSKPGCGFNTMHPVDGKTVLEINHIDGDGSNHSPENLEVICPNCHALTPNYRARNMGNGRKTYYLRVAME